MNLIHSLSSLQRYDLFIRRNNLVILRRKFQCLIHPACLLLVVVTLLYPLTAGAGQKIQVETRVMLIPELQTVLSSEIAASIEEITVHFGEQFSKDQTLIRFDCEMYMAELDKAKAERQEALKIYEVNSRLEKLKSVSALELAVSATRQDRAAAEVELREALVNKCEIKAPFGGKLLARSANPFQYVTPGQPLLEVLDHHNLTVQFFVPSSWVQWLNGGYKFTLRIDETKKKYKAHVTVLGPKVDQVSQSIEVRAKIDGQHPELLAGMSGTAYLVPAK